MRRIIAITLTALCGASLVASGAVAGEDVRTYRIEMYNAFGIVDASEVRVSGVNVGEVTGLDLNEDKRAVVTVELRGDLAELGDETTCSSEPQSLIAEYFIDCKPAGVPLEDNGIVPASRVSQTVQPDLVQNTLREPFRDRLRLLINEFGTGFAGNGEALNEAIRLGAPALTELQGATSTLRSQRKMIRQLNTDSANILGELARQRNSIVDFVDEAEDAARLSNERREDLSTDFNLLDDFLAEFQPTLVELDRLAREQTPLLENLRAAAPELNRLALSLPPFNRASEDALLTLGDAAVVGERALRRGEDEIEQLAISSRKAPRTTEILADFLRDIDDPRRAVEIDTRVEDLTGRTGTEANRRDTMGFTGMEAFLNYLHNTSLTINQYDKVSHLFRFGIYEAGGSGDCGGFSSGRDPDTGERGVPADAGGTTTSFSEADRCIAWLGENQPGVNEDLNLSKYDPAVCAQGTEPASARAELCDPNDAARASSSSGSKPKRSTRNAKKAASRDDGGAPDALPGSGLPGNAQGQLEDLLGDPVGGLGLNGKGKKGKGKNGVLGSGGNATEDLLDFLFAP
ncbi:hypothetical protein BH24ACT23_BH24ACT23_06910 [soil metagenome]